MPLSTLIDNIRRMATDRAADASGPRRFVTHGEGLMGTGGGTPTGYPFSTRAPYDEIWTKVVDARAPEGAEPWGYGTLGQMLDEMAENSGLDDAEAQAILEAVQSWRSYSDAPQGQPGWRYERIDAPAPDEAPGPGMR